MNRWIWKESAIGLQIRDNQVLAVWVRPGWTRYRVIMTWREPFQASKDKSTAIQCVLNKLPAHVPVIPLGEGLQFTTQESPDDLAGALLIQPDLLMSQRQGQTDPTLFSSRDEVVQTMKWLNVESRKAPGVSPPALALQSLVNSRLELKTRNVLILDDDETLTNMAAFRKGRLVYARTVRRRREDLGPEITLTLRIINTKRPDAVPSALCFLSGKTPFSETESGNLPPILSFPEPIQRDVCFEPALGAAMAYLHKGARIFLEPRCETGGFRRFFNPKIMSLMGVAALLLISLNVNLFLDVKRLATHKQKASIGADIETLQKEADGLKKLTGSEKGAILPGESMSRLLVEIGSAVAESEIILDDISSSIWRADMTGRADTMRQIPVFKEALSKKLPNAVVEIMYTNRIRTGEFQFKIAVKTPRDRAL